MMNIGEEESALEKGCTEIEELADGAIINRFKWLFDSKDIELHVLHIYFGVT